MTSGQRQSAPRSTMHHDAGSDVPDALLVDIDRVRSKHSGWSIVLVVSIAVLIASLAMLGTIAYSYYQGQEKNRQISEYADLAQFDGELRQASAAIDWDGLREVNPDVVAWVNIEGTSINHPVVQGSDNEYYLAHDFAREQGWLAQFGSIFLDWRNNPNWSDQAYFIYGHHMNDGSMFADIVSLADQARFDASRTVYLLSPTRSFRLRTFSLLHCASDEPLVQISFSTPQDLASYVQDKIDRSIVSPGEIEPVDRIAKLFAFATCDNYSSGRYVLYAYVEEEVGDDYGR